jgi:hypothetical protein
MRRNIELPAYYREFLDVACELLGVSFGEIVGDTRADRIVEARQCLIGAMRHLLGFSFPEIGCALGRREHSTVFTSFQRFEASDPLDQATWLMSIMTSWNRALAQRPQLTMASTRFADDPDEAAFGRAARQRIGRQEERRGERASHRHETLSVQPWGDQPGTQDRTADQRLRRTG